MKNFLIKKYHWCLMILLSMGMSTLSHAQTDIDALMMGKNNFCAGFVYGQSKWDYYWEGTFKRKNENLGTVSTKMIGFMGNWGVSDKLNLLFNLPYISTKASGGTLHGMGGLQDVSLWAKWMPVETSLGKGTFSVYGLAGLSFPVSNYTPDFLPLSIGLHSTNFSLRGMVDYQLGWWTTTFSATYTLRSDVEIDRSSYYDTVMHITNEVNMPDAFSFNARTGYRSDRMIAELVFNNFQTLGGFDITKNNMPFVSNRMNSSAIGFNLKYNIKSVDGLSLVGDGAWVLSGRNVGKAFGWNAGIFYILDFSPKKKNGTSTKTSTNSK
jgi:hypothetical protein